MKKNVLITGGTGGIGIAISDKLIEQGYQVISTLKNQKDNLKNSKIITIQADVSDYASCEAMAAKVKEKYGKIDIIINNAGVTQDSQFKKMTVDQWQKVICINLNSVFNVTRQFINEMIENKWGRIINISSINGQKGQFGQTNYAASKAGMHGFTMSLAQEVARSGITVNTISPGYTATPMVKAIREDILDGIVNQVPMKRLAEPAEIAAIVSFLCSDDAAYISGANIPINGAQFTSF